MSEQPQYVDMTYHKMRSFFRTAERQNQHLTGYIVISQASFGKECPLKSRTYEVSSDNKAYQSHKDDYSIVASSLDGSNRSVRLERHMSVELGDMNGWQIERCYMAAEEVERAKALARVQREQAR